MNSEAKGQLIGVTSKPLARLALSALFVALFTFTLRNFAGGVEDAPDFSGGNAGAEVVIEIMPGETGSEIAKKLFEANVVKSSLAFFRVAVADSRSSRIAPGAHRLETEIPAKIALNQLLDPQRIPNLIVIRDGARVSEVVDELIKFGFAKDQINEGLKSITAPKLFGVQSLEGFLYPAHYSFNKDVKVDVVLSAMVDKFKWATKDLDWSASSRLKPYELLTIASLVVTEGTPDIFGKVSRVIYNRLEKGIALQFDSTVHYALNRRGEIRVSLADTKVKSRYNTFLYRGLPPSPIGSPTKAAIDAAINPETGDWLYFVTVKPGDTRFTSSYDVFLGWKAEYKKNFKLGLFE